jgi:hypothetical protein
LASTQTAMSELLPESVMNLKISGSQLLFFELIDCFKNNRNLIEKIILKMTIFSN